MSLPQSCWTTMVQPLQCNEFRWSLTPTQLLYCRSSSELSSKGSALFNCIQSITQCSSNGVLKCEICIPASPITPFSPWPAGNMRSQSRVSAALQLLQHQVMGNMYRTGCASRVRLQLQYPLCLSDAPDKLSPSRAEHICSAAVSENGGKGRGERWDRGALCHARLGLAAFSRFSLLDKFFCCFLTSMSPALPIPAMWHTAFHFLPWITSCSQACFVLPNSSLWVLASPVLFIYPFNAVLIIMVFGH